MAFDSCRVCGGSACDETVPGARSGMAFPRNNVRHYMGNAVWDGQGLTAGEGIAAMLGDPFSFAITPELDALRWQSLPSVAPVPRKTVFLPRN